MGQTGFAERRRQNVTGEKVPKGVKVTPEDAGVVADEDGTEHVGVIPKPKAKTAASK